MRAFQVLEGDALSVLRTLEARSVHCCVTSPPYFGLRDYKVAPTAWPAVSFAPMPGVPPLDVPAMECALGLEPTPEAFVAHLVLIFREVRRVLRDDATCWINMGDSYCSTAPGTRNAPMTKGSREVPEQWANARPAGLKPKDLLMIPARMALALQADGWWLRMDNVWAKDNPMPESVTDRATKAHEFVYHLSKSATYYYDADAVREPLAVAPHAPGNRGTPTVEEIRGAHSGKGMSGHFSEPNRTWGNPAGRNKRSVWRINTAGYAGDHYATFPPGLPEPCILAGTGEKGCCPACLAPWERITERVGGGPSTVAERPPREMSQKPYHGGGKWESNGSVAVGTPEIRTTGWRPGCECQPHQPVPCTVLDPFNGRATTGVVALRNGRQYIGIELNPKDVAASEERLAKIDGWQPSLLDAA